MLFITERIVAILNKTFRIFISSTFSDLKEERNALQREVFPELKKLCMQHGFRFQAIDLRWGVREESALDQQTMKICLDEVARCQRPPNPNFIVLLGDRYGWQPLPAEIPASEFEQIEKQVLVKEDQALLGSWYKRDDNALPAVYCIQPRAVRVKAGAPDSEKKRARDEESKQWNKTETSLRRILRDALKRIRLTEDQKLKYESSATEQEIQAGALNVPNAKEHVFSFIRTIEGLPQDESAKDFIDLIEDERKKVPDSGAKGKLNALKDKLEEVLDPGNIFRYGARWEGTGVTTDHIKKLCEDVYTSLSKIIEKEISLIEDRSPLEREIEAHRNFGEERARVFVGRVEILKNIQDYIRKADNHPLAIYGESGTGKSALMAFSLQQAQEQHPGSEVIFRFVGATPESSDGRSLLESLCRQISISFGTGEANIPGDYKELVDEFLKRLALASAKKPLILYLDAIDQLSETDNARDFNWVPSNLPGNVHLIVSTLPGECYEKLKSKIPEINQVSLQAMQPDEGERLLDLWLEDAKRRLANIQRIEIFKHFNREGNGKPLYLKLAFEEVRRWKSYTDNIELSPDIRGVIQDLFKRLSSDENHGDILVSRSLGYLAAAKNGLSEDELIDVLSADNVVFDDFKQRSFHDPPEMRLPVVIWSRLFYDIESYLTERSADGTSLMTFYHPATFGEMVKEKYLAGKEKIHIHQQIANYFMDQQTEGVVGDQSVPNFRKLSELPYQQVRAQMWDAYTETLTDFHFVETKIRSAGPYEMIIDFHEGSNHGFSPPWLLTIQQSLEMSFQTLAHDAGQIPGQLLARLLSFESPEINCLIQGAKKYRQKSWLQPMRPSLIRPGTSLYQTLPLHSRAVLCLSMHSGMDVMLSGGADGIIVLTDMKKWDTIATIALSCDLEGINLKKLDQIWKQAYGEPKPLINSVALSPDGKYVIFSVFPSNNVYVWNVRNHKLVSVLKGHFSSVTQVAVTPDSKTIISAGMDGNINLWSLASAVRNKTDYQRLAAHSDEVTTISLTHDGELLISGSKDKTIQVWDLKRQKCINKIRTGKPVLDLAVSEKDHTVFSISGTHEIKKWSLRKRGSFMKKLLDTGLIEVLRTEEKLGKIAVTSNGRFIVAGSRNTVSAYHQETRQDHIVAHVPEKIDAVLLTTDDKYVISGSTDGRIKLWDIGRSLDQGKKAREETIRTIALTEDGELGATGSADNSIGVWNISEKKMLIRLTGHTADIMAITISPDKQFIVSGSMDNTVRVWDVNSGLEKFKFLGHHNMIMDVEVIRNGEYVISGAKDNTIRIWDMQTGQAMNPVLNLDDRIYALKANADGTMIFASTSKAIYKWSLVWKEYGDSKKKNKSEVLASKRLSRLCGIDHLVKAMEVTDHGKSLYSIDLSGKMSHWDIENKQIIREFQIDSDIVYSLSISKGQDPLMLTAEGRRLRIRNLKDQNIIASFDGDNEFFCCSLSGKADRVIAGDGAGHMHIFHLHEVN